MFKFCTCKREIKERKIDNTFRTLIWIRPMYLLHCYRMRCYKSGGYRVELWSQVWHCNSISEVWTDVPKRHFLLRLKAYLHCRIRTRIQTWIRTPNPMATLHYAEVFTLHGISFRVQSQMPTKGMGSESRVRIRVRLWQCKWAISPWTRTS